ncbi:hypothetical protein C882_3371 [Caenispirillum salinarum AK4]|uniref:Uncharacterized protein n=1 Tax=Caenispirillum salinarum AK4 TaxID=1238182 RepID=K9HAZ2_9PROT|nr:hypothetical protein [Caenispirillum salinarum]EKV25956.1 hypothetical protein C882_3371 [Caenispirillum salinarum AK4]
MRTIRHLPVLAAALLAAAAPSALAGIEQPPEPVPAEAAPVPGGVLVIPADENVRVTCWQDGRKVMEVTNLSVRSVGIPNQVRSLSFQSSLSGGTMTLLPQPDSLCLVQPLK